MYCVWYRAIGIEIMCIDQQEIKYVCKYIPPTDRVSNGYGHIRAVDTLVSLRQVSGHGFQKSQSGSQ